MLALIKSARLPRLAFCLMVITLMNQRGYGWRKFKSWIAMKKNII